MSTKKTVKALQLLANCVDKQHHWKAKLLNRWAEIADYLAEHVWIEMIYEDSIVIAADHSMWAQEVQMLQPQLLFKINRLIGDQVITRLILVVRPQKMQKPQEPSHTEHEPAKLAVGNGDQPLDVALSDDERAALAHVHHEKLSQSLAEFYVACKHRLQSGHRLRLEGERGRHEQTCRDACRCQRNDVRTGCKASTNKTTARKR